MSVNAVKNAIPTIDVSLVTASYEVTSGGSTSTVEIAFDTANQIEVEPQTEEQDAVKLVIKGKLKAQKPQSVTITGHQITLHDNVFIPELVKLLQGGMIKYWQDANHTESGETETNYGVAGYTPPVAGSDEKGKVFTFNAYSAIYNAAGIITGYEKTMYPNCTGVPVAFNSEDDTFRAPEYTINSAPNTGQPPYDISYVKALPEVVGTTNIEGPAATS